MALNLVGSSGVRQFEVSSRFRSEPSETIESLTALANLRPRPSSYALVNRTEYFLLGMPTGEVLGLQKCSVITPAAGYVLPTKQKQTLLEYLLNERYREPPNKDIPLCGSIPCRINTCAIMCRNGRLDPPSLPFESESIVAQHGFPSQQADDDERN